MSFMKTLQSIGILEKDSQPSEKTATPPRTFAPLNQTDALPDAIPTPASGGVLDTEAIMHVIEDHIQSSAAYAPFVQFVETADSMKAAIPDEGVRFRAAALATKADVQSLVASATSFREVLQAEQMKFVENYVAEHESAIQQAAASIEALQEQANTLRQQLADVTARTEAAAAEQLKAQADLGKAKIDFETVIGRIDTRRSAMAIKVTQHLGGSNG